MKKLTLVSVILTLCILFSACSASVASDSAVSNKAYENGYFYSESESADMVTVDRGAGYGSTTMGSTITSDSAAQTEYQEEKLVYTSDVTLETEDFDTANDTLHTNISSLDGIIVSENAYNLSNVGYRSLDMTVRIPQDNYETFLSGLNSAYNVTSIRNTVENLTEYYYDNANRLRSYRVQEERLFAMLEKAETVEDMLDIEERLCDVQYQIESLTNTQNTIDNDVKYATFYISLNEVTKYTSPTPKTFGDRLGETVSNSGETFTEVLEALLFMLIYLAPYLVIAGIVLIIVFASIKHAKKKKARAAEKE